MSLSCFAGTQTPTRRKKWTTSWDFPGSGKESACQCRRQGFNPWSRKFPWRGNGNSLQYSCLENSMDRGVWWAIVHGVTKSWTWLSAQTHTHTHTHQHIDPRPTGTRRWMMLTSEILPSYLTTNLSQECPPADQAPWNPLPQLSFKILPWKPLGSWGLLSQSHLFSLLGPLLSESLSRLDQWRVSPVMLCYSPALRPSGNPLTILFLLPLCKIKITEGLSLRDVRS